MISNLKNLLLAGLLSILSACASLPEQPQPSPAPAPLEPVNIPVMREGRYTLVELEPSVGQRDLMAQVVVMAVPLSPRFSDATVGDALRHGLRRSGYRLCETAHAFDTLPLPLVHAHLWPMQLRDILAILSGPAWTLQIDEAAREVCFVPRVEEEVSEGTEKLR